MQSENKLFDDFVKMVNGVAGTMAGMGREAEASMRDKMREWVGGMDFVSRDEFEADRYAAEQSSPDRLVSALVKLYDDNAATLTPDPVHSAFYDSHPPAPCASAT